jgi:hypothetical protein
MSIKPDYYNSKDECQNSLKNKVQSNLKYSNFNQDIFTAGDEKQFIEFINEKDSDTQQEKKEIEETLNVFENIINLQSIWDKFSINNEDAKMNTFRYMFYKFKKGIYVKIQNNKLKIFLPFSNAKYRNEWGNRIVIDKRKYKDIDDFIKFIYSLESRKFNPKYVNKFTNSWYANNYLLRHEFPIVENDTNVSVIKNMLEELCEKRVIPDIDFFVNRRDFPLFKKDGTEPYNHIWDTEFKKLVSHSYGKYTPILSMCNTCDFTDILFTTAEDWARVQYKENKWFSSFCKDFDDDFTTEWSDKKSKAVFRGSSTGVGTTIDTNARLKASFLTLSNSDVLDAGITKWNLRPRKIQGKKYLETIDISNLPFGLTNTLTLKEQSQYKYILNIDGHVSAYRLSIELSMGSVVLIVKSQYKLWYSDLLEPYVHYVPVNEDLSNLIQQIKWCLNNDEKCKVIAENAKTFYKKYLNKNSLLDYFQKILTELKEKIN